MMNKITQIIIIALILASSALVISADDEQSPYIAVNTSREVDLGTMIKGTHNEFIWDDNTVTFEIYCSENDPIHITSKFITENTDMVIDAEWKAGPVSGFETNFTDGIYTPMNNHFYVTVKINSVTVNHGSPTGKFNFVPSITVKYHGM
ncbi:MAG: hypothetical protein ACLFR2_06665 [Candidatus Kapaibacterium sp.]